MPSFKIPIKGMNCKACEILIEDKLKEIKGVDQVNISHRRGEAQIFYQDIVPDMRLVTEAITSAGYSLGNDEKKITFFSRNISDYKELAIALLVLIIIYLLVKNFGLANLNINPANAEVTIPLILMVGLVAGLSTCLALVGGLVLGLSVKYNQLHPASSGMEKFRPHLFFNFGRILSYAFFGGLLGLIGSAFQLSASALGLLIIAIGLFMLIIGLQLIAIFPWAQKLKLTLPKILSKFMGLGRQANEYSHTNSFILGAVTFFLPCGFTQAMQVYAIGTGTFIGGAIVMSLFALGTIPGLLGIGGLTSIINGTLTNKFFKFAGLAVIAFGIFNIANGFGLLGWNFAFGQTATSVNNDQNVMIANGIQIVKMKETNSGYEPNSFTIKKNIPVRWEIDAQAPFSCAASLVLSKYNIRKTLTTGLNVIEFTPTETGRLPFSCSMGMYTGAFNVVDENGQTSSSLDLTAKPAQASGQNTCGLNSGSSCGSPNNLSAQASVSTETSDKTGCGCSGGNNKTDFSLKQNTNQTAACH